MAQYKKGDSVYTFGNWNSEGVFSSSLLVVQSCGAKRMTALREEGGNMIKCFIYAENYAALVPAADLPTAEAVAEEGTKRAAVWIAEELARNIGKRGHTAYHQPAIERNIAMLEVAQPVCRPHHDLCAEVRQKYAK